MPNAGDELHHFGWNACSSCLCPNAPHPHAERRYLVVPGLRSSRIHILDTKPDPRKPKIVKVIEPDEVADKAGYTRPHTVHCGPEGIYVAALGNREGKGPGGIFLMDHETFEVRGQWEIDRGPAALRLRRLVAPRPRHHGDERVGHARHLRERADPRGPARRQVRPPAALLGPAQEEAPADHRLRRQVPARVRAAARARPDQGLRLRQLRHQPGEPLVVDLDLVQGRRQVGGQEDHRDPGRAGHRGPAAAPAQGLQGGAAAGHRHRSVDGRQVPLRGLLGHRRPAAVRRVRSLQARSSPARCASAASSPRRRIPAPRTARSTAGRRWWRSAATGSASTSPTRSTAPSTRSSIPTASRAGW